MLNALREKTQGLIGAALLVVLVVPFVLWGVSSYFGGSHAVYVARGHGVRITQAQFAHTLARQRAALEQAFGKNLNPALLSSRKFKEAVLKSLINKMLLIRAANRSGYTTDPRQLAAEIRAIPAFRVKGHFSPARYRALLQGQGFTVAGFERRVRDFMLLNQLKTGLLASSIVPNPDIVAAARLFGQKRAFSYVVLSPKDFRTTAIPSAAEIATYYQDHEAAFRKPQQIRVAYLILSPDAVMKTLPHKVGMAALERAYRDHIQQFTQPAERQVRHIMIALPPHASASAIARANATLLALRTRLLHGASFAALARQYSQDPSSAPNGGQLGFVSESDLSKAVGPAVFALPLKKISAPIVGRSGVHLFEVTALRPASVDPIASVTGELTRMVLHARARRRLYHVSERLRNAAFEHPHHLGKVARRLHLTLKTSGWFSRAGGAGIASLPAVVKAVFAPKVLAGRRNTHAIPLGEDALLVAHVIARKPPQTQPLAAVRALIIQKIQAARSAQRLAARQQLLLAELRKGAALPVVARQMHLVVVHPAPIEAVAPGLPQGLVHAVFRAPLPQAGKPAVGSAHLGKGRRAVFVLTSVVPGAVKLGGARYTRLAKSLITDSGIQMYLAYLKSLRERAHIHIRSQAL